MHSLLNSVSAPLFPGVDLTTAASMGGRETWEDFKDVIRAYEVSSSLPLQVCLYFNAWLFPVWFVCGVVMLTFKFEALSELFQPLAVTVVVSITVLEVIRIYLGYSGNLLEKIPELFGFWLLTFLVQLPLVVFALLSPGLVVASVERTVNSIHLVFVILELAFGYGAVKRIARKQVLRFKAMQKSVALAARNRQMEESSC